MPKKLFQAGADLNAKLIFQDTQLQFQKEEPNILLEDQNKQDDGQLAVLEHPTEIVRIKPVPNIIVKVFKVMAMREYDIPILNQIQAEVELCNQLICNFVLERILLNGEQQGELVYSESSCESEWNHSGLYIREDTDEESSVMKTTGLVSCTTSGRVRNSVDISDSQSVMKKVKFEIDPKETIRRKLIRMRKFLWERSEESLTFVSQNCEWQDRHRHYEFKDDLLLRQQVMNSISNLKVLISAFLQELKTTGDALRGYEQYLHYAEIAHRASLESNPLNRGLTIREISVLALYQKLRDENLQIQSKLDENYLANLVEFNDMRHDIEKCPVSGVNVIKALFGGDCICLGLKMYRPPMARKDPSTLEIRDIELVYVTADKYIETLMYQICRDKE